MVDLPAARATVLVGEFAGARSPARTDSPLVGVDIAGSGRLDLPLEASFEHAVAVLHGGARIGDSVASPNQLMYIGAGRDGVRLDLMDSSRVLLLGGHPFAEEILMWWNFVARDRSELEQAYAGWGASTERFGTVTSTLERIEAPRPFWLP
jgi:redox-sensitive bicupin YhaK (pirin superfamily)